jgi:glycosidase
LRKTFRLQANSCVKIQYSDSEKKLPGEICMSNPLESLKTKLKNIQEKTAKIRYRVPSLWVPLGKEPVDGKPPVSVEPAEFFLSHIEAIEKNAMSGIDPCKSLNSQIPEGQGGSWIAGQSIYNIFVRLTAAYDHDGDGQLGGSKADLTLNADGLRESGTFLKCIAMLGYIKALGCNTIHLLPVTSIGHDGNKGDLGSPYAIKNPYKLEETLADPLIDMNVEDQFRAFVQAAHMIGIRVVAEFVFRTASKDSDWIATNPEWFYWIDEEIIDRDPGETDPEKIAAGYGNPVFNTEELAIINQKVANHDFNELPAPPEYYRDFFKAVPEKSTVALNRQGQYRGLSPKGKESGKTVGVRIPGAFADWPPDDNQPPWGDVTYLRMYRDENAQKPEFNYIAYNTIRMYDRRLARAELANESLWKTIEELIPTYQREYGIDGVMVDMGHAVPVSLMQNIISTARQHDENFAFLSENFEIREDSVDAGYNAVVGYAWWVEYRRDGMYDLLNHIGNEGVPLSFFGAVENHNTPRAAGRPGGEKYARYAFLVNTMLPHAIPFIHSGQELGETMPVNTGLDFSNEDLEKLKGKKLALFDLCGYQWDGTHPMFNFVRRVLSLRKKYAHIVGQTGRESFATALTGQADVICFVRKDGKNHLAVVFNRDLDNTLAGELELEWAIPESLERVNNLLAEPGQKAEIPVSKQRIAYSLKPGECYLLYW